MPLYLTGARSSRVTKPRPQRTSSLPFNSAKPATSLHRAHTVANILDGHVGLEEEGALAPTGKLVSVVDNSTSDVLSAIKYARTTMFEPLPDRAGMNSVGIAEVLNFQKNLPAVVSLAHIHALRSASSKTERDIQYLLAHNEVRRLQLVGRGNEVSGLKELLIATRDYEGIVRASSLPDDVVSSFIAALQANPRVHALPTSFLTRLHIELLFRAGFLVAPSLQSSRNVEAGFGRPAAAAPILSRSTSCPQAVSFDSSVTFESLGGVGSARRSKTTTATMAENRFVLSVPGLSSYLQLVDASRNHFLDLLRQFSRHRQAPMYLLRERWNGNIDDNANQISVAKRIRGEFSNVLPAKTKKWKSFRGLSFDWVLAECLGAGLVELFETHSVGLGVRALV